LILVMESLLIKPLINFYMEKTNYVDL
jgi:hypothetical protein